MQGQEGVSLACNCAQRRHSELVNLRALAGPTAVSRAELVTSAIPSGARVSGATADAVVTIDAVEHRRRAGLAGVDDLGLLDALMDLPIGAEVPVYHIGAVARAHLRASPPGCVDWLSAGAVVRRLLVPAATVELIVVRADCWPRGLARAAAFEPFATRVVLLQCQPRAVADIAWEADAAGVGLWLRQTDGEITEIVPPAPFVRRYVKPAGWRFTERAYTAWVNATSR